MICQGLITNMWSYSVLNRSYCSVILDLVGTSFKYKFVKVASGRTTTRNDTDKIFSLANKHKHCSFCQSLNLVIDGNKLTTFH